MDTFYCRNCGVGLWASNEQEAAELHGTDHAFELQARIDDKVTDPFGREATVTQVIEDGEVALVQYADGAEDEFEIHQLVVVTA